MPERVEDLLDDRHLRPRARPGLLGRRRPAATRCALYDGIALDPPGRRQSASMRATSRVGRWSRDQPGDEVEQPADGVDRRAVRRRDRVRHAEERAEVQRRRCRAASATSRSSGHAGQPQSCAGHGAGVAEMRPRRIAQPHCARPPTVTAPRRPPPTRASTRCSITPGADLRYLTGLRRAAARAADLPASCPRAASRSSSCPRLERAGGRGVRPRAGVEIADAWGETDDPYAARRRSRSRAKVGAGRRGQPDVGRAGAAAARRAARRRAVPRRRGAAPTLRMRKRRDEVDALRRAGAGDRPRARPDGGVAAARAHRARGRPRHRRRDPRRGARRRSTSSSSRPAPTAPARTTSTSDRVIERRRPGRGRHRRHDAGRLLLGLHPHVLACGEPPAEFAALLRGAARRPAGRRATPSARA